MADKFLKESYKEKFYYEALRRPWKLEERVSHHAEDIFDILVPNPDEIFLSNDIECWELSQTGWQKVLFSEYKKYRINTSRGFAIAEDASFICAEKEYSR